MRHLISILDLSKQDIEHILKTAQTINPSEKLKGKILASCFFEPSTRTRLSFETAMLRLGGSYIGFSEASVTSMKKGESLADTIKVISNYADVIVIRHKEEGAAELAAKASNKPVINAGDGTGEHPTQTLVDLFSIQQTQGKIDGLQIALAGDLKYGRAIHSLCLGLTYFSARLYFIAPEGLGLPETIERELKRKGVEFSFHKTLDEVTPKIDILYMSRIQKERLIGSKENPVTPYKLTSKDLEVAKKNLKILHPLPRIDEIGIDIDTTPYAYYFEQASCGVSVRMALLLFTVMRLKMPA